MAHRLRASVVIQRSPEERENVVRFDGSRPERRRLVSRLFWEQVQASSILAAPTVT